MNRRRLIILLPHEAYDELEQHAERQERTADQQASFVVRQWLSGEAVHGASTRLPHPEREPIPAA